MSLRNRVFLSALLALVVAAPICVAAPNKDGRAGSWRKGEQGAPDLKAAQARVDKNPKDAEALNDLGFALRQNGKAKEAEKYLKQAIEANPKMTEAHVNLSVNYYDQQMYKEALAEAQEAVKINPDHAISRVVLGNALSKTGDLKGAMQEYKVAVHLQPDYENAHYNLGRVQNEAGETNDAKMSLVKALELDPNDGRVLQLLDKLEKGDTTTPKDVPASKDAGKKTAGGK